MQPSNYPKELREKMMEIEFDLWNVLFSIAFLGIFGLFVRLYIALVVKPKRLQAALRKQGINGPPPMIILGNLLDMKRAADVVAAKTIATNGVPKFHNCGSTLLPSFDQWRNQYGEIFMFSLGTTQILHVTQPDLIKEINSNTSLDLGKPLYIAQTLGTLLGNGILTSNGPIWVHQRRTIAPELYMDKVKGMINIIQKSSMTLINSWKNMIENEGGVADINIGQHLKRVSGDVINGACFGRDYANGEEIIKRITSLHVILSRNGIANILGIPGLRYLPTKSNREAWALEKEIKALILKVVKEKNESAEEEKNLLQMLLEGAKDTHLYNSQDDMDRFIIDNCKNIYLAGYETTATSATWCLMLLAANPDWQHRIRAEVVDICKGQLPDADMIRKMKQLTMAINESLRLYPPAIANSREALKDMKIGDINVPKGVTIWTVMTMAHTDPESWGPDSYEFNPERFANGINSACKFPQFYTPFGVGQRVCAGQNLALVELKILIALILSNFSFSISPKYVHSPIQKLVVEPGHGVNLLVKKL